MTDSASLVLLWDTICSLGQEADLVGSLGGGFFFQIRSWEPLAQVAVSDSSHLPSIDGLSITCPPFSKVPDTCANNQRLHRVHLIAHSTPYSQRQEGHGRPSRA